MVQDLGIVLDVFTSKPIPDTRKTEPRVVVMSSVALLLSVRSELFAGKVFAIDTIHIFLMPHAPLVRTASAFTDF